MANILVQIMNDSDALYLFLMRGISSIPKSHIRYFCDRIDDSVFSVIENNNKFQPSFRNSYTSEKTDLNLILEEKIQRLEVNDFDIIELPKLSFQDKINFFQKFTEKIQEQEVKNLLLKDLENINESSEFGFTIDIKKIKFSLAFDFDIYKGKFLHDQIFKMYNPLGITEKTNLIW